MRFAVIQFPGSNCDQDCVQALKVLGQEARLVWHQEKAIGPEEGVILPGGIFLWGLFAVWGDRAVFADHGGGESGGGEGSSGGGNLQWISDFVRGGVIAGGIDTE